MEAPPRSHRALAFLALGIPFALYVVTLCRDVFVGDSGEMVTIACRLGIPQPTGFPIFCLAGRVFFALPLGTPAARVNLLSAAATAGTCLAIFHLLVRFCMAEIALAGALFYGLSRTPWSQATIARTYPLTEFLLAVEVLLAIQVLERPGQRRCLALALLSGFSLSGHLLSILILPILGYVAFFESWGRRIAGGALFVLGLSLYVYVPMRAPVTDYNVYGAVDTPRQFWSYLREERYKDKQFARSRENVAAFGGTLAREASRQLPGCPLWALLIVAGVGLAWRTSPPLVVFLCLASGLNVFILLAYGDNKDIPFLPRYFLFVWGSAAVFWAMGVSVLVKARPPPQRPWVLFAVYGFLIYGGVVNFRVSDRSLTQFPVAYARALLLPLPDRSVLFLAGDAPLLMCDYLQHVLSIRTDVTIVDRERWGTMVGLFRAGKVPTRPTFANFLPAELPRGHHAIHAGLTWQITDHAAVVDRKTFWQSLPPEPIVGDPALNDYEAAALAGEIFFHRGLDFIAAGDPGQARASFATARQVSPDNRLLCYSLAKVCQEQGWTSEAQAFIAAGIKLEVVAPEQLAELTALHYQQVGLPPP